MALKNYTTTVKASKTVGQIQELLSKHGAQRVSIEYGEGGRVLGLSFLLVDSHGSNAFRLPARAENVKRVLQEQGIKCDDSKAEDVAWRNVKDWVDAQIALIETGQVGATEVMLPYMLDKGGRTLFENFCDKALPEGDK